MNLAIFFSDQSDLICKARNLSRFIANNSPLISACMIYVDEYFALITELCSDHADILHCMYLCNNSSKLFIIV